MLGLLSKVIVGPLHDRLVFDRRSCQLAESVADLLPEGTSRGLDIGCGSGAVARRLMHLRPGLQISGADVLVRPNAVIPVVEFDGCTLPFAEGEFEFALLIDVLHHTTNQAQLLAEALRVAKFVAIKDHYCESTWDKQRLSFMDWVGNRSHGVRLPYCYLSREQWLQLYGECNARESNVKEELGLYPGVFNKLFGEGLHFVARVQAAC